MAWLQRRGKGGRLWYRVLWRDPYTGGVRSKSIGTDSPDIAEAERVRVEREEERRAPQARVVTASDILDAWIADRRARNRAERTLQSYRHGMRATIAALGERVGAWTVEAVETWVHGHRWKARTVDKRLVEVGSFLRFAARRGWSVPAGLREGIDAIERPSSRITDPEVFTPAQVSRLVTAAKGTRWYLPVLFAARAGLSLGDLKALRAEEIDLRTRTLWRRQGRAKTGERLRVPLDPEIVTALRADRPSGPLVCDIRDDHDAQNGLRDLCDRARVPLARGEGWHKLRRTFLTGLDARGVGLASIRALAGHAPGSTVTLRYLRPDFDGMRRALKR